jgi:hypothetical protein
MSMTRGLCVLALLAFVGAAHADSPAPLLKRARVHLERGLRAYSAKDYRAAIAAFRAGYATQAHPDFLFAWAQAERLRGDCASAVSLYEQYLTRAPPTLEREAAQRAQAHCQTREPARHGVAAPLFNSARERAAPLPEARAPLVPDRDAPDTPFRHDAWGNVLLAAGVVGLGVGLGYTLAANTAETDAQRARTYGDYVAHSERAELRRTLGIVLMSSGSGLVVGGILRYIAAGRSGAGDLSLSGDPRHVLVSVRTAF